MAVNYVSRRCNSCSGRLEYQKQNKTWLCLYCGNVMEREEQYEGAFTIKNVVRQTLLDTAAQKMENADKNLMECEKIDSRYLGTQIARLCYLTIKSVPGVLPLGEGRGFSAQIARAYTGLLQEYPTLTDEEEVLYEFFDSADIFATLLLVYDTVGDTARASYVMELLEVSQVYSTAANCLLLNYLLKKNMWDKADVVFANTSNIDISQAVETLLENYPCTPQKAEHLETLLAEGMPPTDANKLMEQYLQNTADNPQTKAQVAVAACRHGLRPAIGTVLGQVLGPLEDAVNARLVFDALLQSGPMSDDERHALLLFCLGEAGLETALAGIEALATSGVFLLPETKHFSALLDRQDAATEEKIALLEALYALEVPAKTREGVVGQYLCSNTSPAEQRLQLFPLLIGHAAALPLRSVENYLLTVGTDGGQKPEVLALLLAAGPSQSYFAQLPGRYLNQAKDSPAVKEAILQQLLDWGLALDASSFSGYVCGPGIPVSTRLEFVQKLRQNGTQPSPSLAAEYLASLRGDQMFDPALFALVYTDNSLITEPALVVYLLYCRDYDTVKAARAVDMGAQLGGWGEVGCQISHLGNSIECRLVQGYVLATPDSDTVAGTIVQDMLAARARLNAPMQVNGNSEKLKKYALTHRQQLSPVTETLCRKHKVYTAFF